MMCAMERHRPKERQPVSLAEAAKNYAEQGWPVFPLAGKYPYKGTHGYLDATNDPQEVTRMWQERPAANIGLATGAVSGVIVLDIDPRNAVKQKQQANPLRVLEERYGTQFRNTRTVRTAHGGLHLYYQHPKDGKTYPNAVKLGGRGIDARGDGGYVVLPPSKLYNSLSYQWGNTGIPIAQAPEWLLALLSREKQGISPQESRFAQSPGSKWLAQAIQEASEGNRNLTGFQLACQLRDDGLSETQAAEIMLDYAKHVPQGKTPYTVKEALASLRSVYRRPPRERARSNF
jgi:hypothetical protein